MICQISGNIVDKRMVSWSARYFQGLHRNSSFRDTALCRCCVRHSTPTCCSSVVAVASRCWGPDRDNVVKWEVSERLNFHLLQLIQWKSKHIRSIISICPNASQRPPLPTEQEKRGSCYTYKCSELTNLSLLTLGRAAPDLNNLDRHIRKMKNLHWKQLWMLSFQQSSEDCWWYSAPNYSATTLHDYDRLDSVPFFTRKFRWVWTWAIHVVKFQFLFFFLKKNCGGIPHSASFYKFLENKQTVQGFEELIVTVLR